MNAQIEMLTIRSGSVCLEPISLTPGLSQVTTANTYYLQTVSTVYSETVETVSVTYNRQITALKCGANENFTRIPRPTSQ